MRVISSSCPSPNRSLCAPQCTGQVSTASVKTTSLACHRCSCFTSTSRGLQRGELKKTRFGPTNLKPLHVYARWAPSQGSPSRIPAIPAQRGDLRAVRLLVETFHASHAWFFSHLCRWRKGQDKAACRRKQAVSNVRKGKFCTPASRTGQKHPALLKMDLPSVQPHSAGETYRIIKLLYCNFYSHIKGKIYARLPVSGTAQIPNPARNASPGSVWGQRGVFLSPSRALQTSQTPSRPLYSLASMHAARHALLQATAWSAHLWSRAV